MRKVYNGVYLVGSSGCSVYLIDTESVHGLVLIDCGMDINQIKNIKKLDLNPKEIKHCIITHNHIDHIAACKALEDYLDEVKFYAHQLDAEAIEEKGHDNLTAASWYGVNYQPVKLYKKFIGDKEILELGYKFQIIHTPGHTPGSISVLVEIKSKKILFGQDIHGPFSRDFKSNLKDYQNSMQKLLDLEADILCEGHFGIIRPAEKVKEYIKRYMRENKP
ncbi:MAG: Zn-dependent hydrolase [Promethearchaeota archaeon]|nr:MAG: Zn-dependent hydrolase [Candidatus Lokiarchaeota archaeon]